jgi:hypothetical protein
MGKLWADQRRKCTDICDTAQVTDIGPIYAAKFLFVMVSVMRKLQALYSVHTEMFSPL